MNNRIKTRVGFVIIIIFVIFVIVGVTIGLHNMGYSKTLRIKKDTYVSEQFPDANYGAEEYLRVGNYSNYGEVQAFYYFDVSSLPADWTEARIEVKFEYGSGEVDIGANLTYESWDEMTITWNNKPTASIYRGHILCDGFDFGIPLTPEHIKNGVVGVCLYARGGETNDYIQGSTKEGNSNAIIELHYIGISPFFIIISIVVFSAIGIPIGAIVIYVKVDEKRYKRKHNNFRADRMDPNIDQVERELVEREERFRRVNPRRIPNANPVNNPQRWEQRARRMEELDEILREINNGAIPIFPGMTSHVRPSKALFEKKINDYITLRFENNRTIIYVAGRRIIQCVHLILNIPKYKVPVYDEIDSVDEAADVYRKQGGYLGHIRSRAGGITPEQEFWGHCSNIQAWVEHDYDTRILMSNLAFPLLRELTRAGDPVAKRVYKEEVAHRLESGYPSVVQYLLDQGYIGVFAPSEFESILEATDIIQSLSSYPGMLNQFVRSCFSRFPTLIEKILLQILKLQEGKKFIFSIIQKSYTIIPFRSRMKNLDLHFLQVLNSKFESLRKKVEEDTIKKDISDCIKMIKKTTQEKEKDLYPSSYRESIFLRGSQNRFLNFAGEDRENRNLVRTRIMDNIRELEALRNGIERRPRIQRRQARCSYCGRIIPQDQDFCEWCGHRRDDDDDFFPYPFIFRDPGGGGGGGGSLKGDIAIPVKVRV